MIIENESLRNKYHIFNSRKEAGNQLISFLEKESMDMLLAIPNGGIPVAEPLFHHFQPLEFNLLLIRKVHVPWTQEAGMGAVTPDGRVFFNQEIINTYNIDEEAVERKVKEALVAIEERKRFYELSDYDVKDKVILIIDDGVASGFSMIAGATWLREMEAKKIIIAVPTAPLDSLKQIEDLADKIICLNVRTRYPFAVADAYKNWYDVSSNEAKNVLKEIRKA
ncbi:MAG: phosphoribosyltransferase [Candidatus Heimdallarchaeota archaeon]|nr:phosphoribosyltransferase [Candidatus Heimdallarchaeota archaeon]MCK4877114.1 phosphoribosyltransferase [Candidatus Heimdallarchaeota archaeon]